MTQKQRIIETGQEAIQNQTDKEREDRDLKDEKISSKVHKVYKVLKDNNIEVLFDDREEVTAGEKFSDADLLGMPFRAVISARSLKENGIELKKRTEEKGKIVSEEELLKLLANPDRALDSI